MLSNTNIHAECEIVYLGVFLTQFHRFVSISRSALISFLSNLFFTFAMLTKTSLSTFDYILVASVNQLKEKKNIFLHTLSVIQHVGYNLIFPCCYSLLLNSQKSLSNFNIFNKKNKEKEVKSHE